MSNSVSKHITFLLYRRYKKNVCAGNSNSNFHIDHQNVTFSSSGIKSQRVKLSTDGDLLYSQNPSQCHRNQKTISPSFRKTRRKKNRLKREIFFPPLLRVERRKGKAYQMTHKICSSSLRTDFCLFLSFYTINEHLKTSAQTSAEREGAVEV